MGISEEIAKAAMGSLDWAKKNPTTAETLRNARENAIKPYGKPTVTPPKLNEDGSAKSNK